MRKALLLLLICTIFCQTTAYNQTNCEEQPSISGLVFDIAHFGQSMTMNSCTGSYFHSFVYRMINSNNKVLKIYQGQSTNSANLLYTKMFPSTFSILKTLLLEGGTCADGGNNCLQVVNGQQYTVEITLLDSTAIVYRSFSENYANGQFFKDGTFNSDQDMYFQMKTTSMNPLPVELTHFTAKQQPQQFVQLNWGTATESNNEGFEIERSPDGATWKTIDFVPGHGTRNEPLSYVYADYEPMKGGNYYRLKQLDFDGAFAYSKVVNIQPERSSVQLFPNPVHDQLTIKASKSKATIYNLLGQPLKVFVIRDQIITIDVESLGKGTYYLEVLSANGEVDVQSFIKD